MTTKLKYYLLSLSVFLIPFYFFRFSVWGIRTNVLEVSILLAFVFFLIDQFYTKRKFNFGSIWVYLFLASTLIGFWQADDKIKALGIMKGWFVIPALLYFIILNTPELKRKSNFLLLPLYSSVMIISLWGILQKAGTLTTLFYQVGNGNFNQYLGSNLRAFGPFESPNYLAMFLVPALFLILALINFKANWHYPALVSLVLPLIALYFTKSQGGMLALLGGLLVFVLATLFLKKRRSAFRAAILPAFPATLTLIGWLVLRINPNTASNVLRAQIYEYSIQMIKSNILFGVGLGSFQNKIGVLSERDGSFRAYGLDYALHPHNLFMTLWLNLGIAGLIVFTILLINYFKKILSLRTASSFFLLAAISAIVIHGLVDTTYFKNDLSAIFWIIFALPYLAKTKSKKAA